LRGDTFARLQYNTDILLSEKTGSYLRHRTDSEFNRRLCILFVS